MTQSRAWRHALAILAGTTLLRLAVGATVPLFPDETYYWDWSRTLRAGYFDHPPMIAILVRAGTSIFGVHAIGVRFFSILAGTGAIYAVALTSRELAGDGAAKLAVLLLACMPLAAVGLILATPDAPMLCAAAWALYAVVRALTATESDGRRQHGAVVAPRGRRDRPRDGVQVHVRPRSRLDRARLHPPRTLAEQLRRARSVPRRDRRGARARAGSLVELRRTTGCRSGFSSGTGWRDPQGGVLAALNRELELVGGQIGLVSPILFFFVVRAIKRSFEPTPDGVRLVLGVTALCCLAFFVYSATHRRAEANWPAIAWIPAVILLATEPVGSDRSERWLARGLVLGGVLSAVVCLHAVYPIIPLRADRDQVAKAYGWELLGAVVDRHLEAVQGRPSAGNDLYVAAERYQDASELAYHLKSHPRVYSLNLLGRANQYDLWITFDERAGPGAGDDPRSR